MVRIDGLLHGPLGALGVRCIIDTGCPLTLIDTAIVDKLGYGAKMGKRAVRLWGIETSQEGYHLEVSRLEIMGLDLRPVGIVCHDFLPQFGIEGLIGMDLLAGHILTLDCITGTITLGP